jgi:hypothetical protein
MFKYKNKFFTTLLVVMGIFTSIVWASVPNQPGPYIGVSVDDNCSTLRIDFLDNSDNEDGFIIFGDINKTIPANDETQSAYVYVNLENIECNRTYKIQAMAYNSDGNSTPTDVRDFNLCTTFSCPCCDDDPCPSGPGPYIGVTDINCTAVRISFLDNSDNEDGFRIIGDINKTIPANNTQNAYVYANLENLECNKTYKIQVMAYKDDCNSTLSDVRTFNIHTTFGVDCSSCTDSNEVPNAPGPYIGVTDINKTAVRVNFVDNSDNETGFRIFGSDLNGSDFNVTIPAKSGTGSEVYANLTNLICNKQYTIYAVASNNSGDSDVIGPRYFRISTSFGISCN